MAHTDARSILASIRTQRETAPLSILTLAEPILSEAQHSQKGANDSPSQPSRDGSSLTPHDPSPQLDPATLAADLQHYRDLFSKLRFSYLEQVTKEKYLRSIVGDPPVLYTATENAALEDRLVGMKSELKGKKAESELLVGELELTARRLAGRYEFVTQNERILEALPDEIEGLEMEIEELRRQVREKEREIQGDGEEMETDGVDLNMGLAETQEALEEHRRKAEDIDAQIAALQAMLPGKIRECESAERQLEEVEIRRNEVTKLATEIRRVREEGGRDVLEDQGRWLRGEETLLRGLLGVDVGVES